MTTIKFSVRSLIGVLLATIFTTSAIADEPAPEFHLKGILVSDSNRSVLVNQSVAREGDIVAGVKIISISESEVLVEMASRQLSVRVGFAGEWNHPSSPPPILQSSSDKQYGPVKRGETLSQIAELKLNGNVSLNQMMIALYEANPWAFAGNINELREGVILRVPDDVTLQRQAHEIATAEVTRQIDAWRIERQQPAQVAQVIERQQSFPVAKAVERQQSDQVAKVVEPKSYGPVVWGETLSHIAARISPADTNMNDMMIALYDANPQAFSGNIDVLREGAVLRIPDENALNLQAHDTSSAGRFGEPNSGWYDHGQPLQLLSAVGHGALIFDLSLDGGNVDFPIKGFE